MNKQKRKRQLRQETPAAEFIAPYSLEECLYRLEVKTGDYFGVHIAVHYAPHAHDQGYEFTVRAGRNSYRQPASALSQSGSLKPEDSASTRVMLWREPSFPYVMFLPILLVVVALLGNTPLPNPLLLIPFYYVGGFFALLWYSQRNSERQMVEFIQKTLGYIPEKAKRS